jgi:hypothetical protein
MRSFFKKQSLPTLINPLFLQLALVILTFTSNFIADTDTAVYAVGYYTDSGVQKACYWKSTERTNPHPTGAPDPAVYGIAVVAN